MKQIILALLVISMIASCRSSRKISTAITKKDTVVTAVAGGPDTAQLIRTALQKIEANRIGYNTFNGKVNVDYSSADGKKYDVNVILRMRKDSAIWMSANAILGIEAMRVLITKDSIKVINKLEKTYTARSIDYIQEVTSLPLTLNTLQDLIIGNPVYVDSNIVAYSATQNGVSLLSLGRFFKNLLTLDQATMTLKHSKLDDVNLSRNRTADLAYDEYETKRGPNFSTRRSITVSEKKRLDVKLDFKQYEFNQEVSFPFSIPKNYDRP
ncbi:MAG TPA: DUF4292 domain-containing protein [Flavisolibacter sp.]|jgi:hypothetical protein|nr:DUF4292 domain-containing protein [Flavisolibacter sp.]